jgi:hypothetical protein
MALTVGRTIATAFRLYRQRFADFLLISLKATTWLSIPFLVFLLGGAGIATMAIAAVQSSSPESAIPSIAGLAVLLIVIYFALLFYCGAKSFTNEALIARLTFLDLSGKPETVKVSWNQIRRRMWHIWLARFMVGLILLAIGYGISIASGFLLVFLELIWRESILVDLVGYFLNLASYAVQLWFTARLLVPDLSVAM